MFNSAFLNTWIFEQTNTVRKIIIGIALTSSIFLIFLNFLEGR